MPGLITPDSITDPVLVAACCNGDERAAAELVERHVGALGLTVGTEVAGRLSIPLPELESLEPAELTMIALRTTEAQISRDEIKEQSKYLNPVQRARLYVMRERFAHRLKELHGDREDRGFRREVREHRGEDGHHRGEDGPRGRERMAPDSTGRS